MCSRSSLTQVVPGWQVPLGSDQRAHEVQFDGIETAHRTAGAELADRITLAQLYAATGRPGRSPMAQSILTDAESMRSQRVRDRLTHSPMHWAVRDSTCRDMTQRVRQLQTA